MVLEFRVMIQNNENVLSARQIATMLELGQITEETQVFSNEERKWLNYENYHQLIELVQLTKPNLIQPSTKYTNAVVLNEQKKICSTCLAVNDSDLSVCKRCQFKFEEQFPDSSTNPSEIIEKEGESGKFVTCKSCNHKCSQRATKCPKCGAEFLKMCTICSAEIPVDSKLCPECGDPEPFALPYGTRQQPLVPIQSSVCSINDSKKSCGNSTAGHEYVNQSINKTLARSTLLGSVHHPWRRLFARFIDTFGWSVVLYYLVFTVCENPLISAFMAIPLSIFLEATLLSITGSTLGKWIFGITLKTTSGEKLLFNQALSRSFRVVFQGAGMGIPVIGFFTQIFAYRRLVRTGTTLWDTATETVVFHKEWGVTRAILCTLSVLFVLILSSVSKQVNRELLRTYIDSA